MLDEGSSEFFERFALVVALHVRTIEAFSIETEYVADRAEDEFALRSFYMARKLYALKAVLARRRRAFPAPTRFGARDAKARR